MSRTAASRAAAHAPSRGLLKSVDHFLEPFDLQSHQKSHRLDTCDLHLDFCLENLLFHLSPATRNLFVIHDHRLNHHYLLVVHLLAPDSLARTNSV